VNSQNWTRRNFVAVAGALALEAQQEQPIRVAVIGVGNRGAFLLRHALKVPGVRVVAVCDLDEERARQAAAAVAAAGGEAAIYSDYRKMLDERKDLDAVIIATPVDSHKAISLTALEMGKHVYCEKPMSNNEADTRMMARAARSAKGIFQAGFQLRHDPNRRASVDFVKSGNLGRVLFLQGYRHTGDLPRQTLWYFDRSRSGDNIVEQACHIIDLFVWTVGKPPLRAFGSGGINLYKDIPPGRTTMDNYAVIYEFPDDIRMVFSHIYFDPPGFSGIKERVFCAEGAIDLAQAIWVAREQRGENKLTPPDAGSDASYLSLAAFFDNARHRKTPLNNADSAELSTLVALMGRKAIYEKRVVTWDEMQG
jgi:predicted dehydrogenase